MNYDFFTKPTQIILYEWLLLSHAESAEKHGGLSHGVFLFRTQKARNTL